MDDEKSRALMKELDRFIVISAAISIVVLLAAGLLLSASPQDPRVGFLLGVVGNLVAVLVVFLVSYFVLRRAQRLRASGDAEALADLVSARAAAAVQAAAAGSSTAGATFFDEFGKVPWEQLLGTCSTLDVVVHYFDTWINDHSKALEDLLNRGGHIRFVLPNPQNEALVRGIKERFPEYDLEQVRTKIAYTHRKLALLMSACTHRHARAETHYVDVMPLYCGIRFDRRVLVLSVYEHNRRMRVGAPAMMLQLDTYPREQEWYEKELSYFMASAVRHEVVEPGTKV